MRFKKLRIIIGIAITIFILIVAAVLVAGLAF